MKPKMHLTAYVLAADPAWVGISVLSYYDLVEEMVISYDENGKGWTGAPIPVDECIYFPTPLSFDIFPAAETHIEQLRRDESWLEEMDIICAASATKAKNR